MVERLINMHKVASLIPAFSKTIGMTSWQSGLRRYVQVVHLVGVGSNNIDVIFTHITPRNINDQWKVAVPFIQTIFMCNIYITEQTKNMLQSINMDI